MSDIMGFSVLSLVAIILAALGSLLHVIGMSVVYWIVSDPFVSGVGIGLWQTCGLITCSSYQSTPDYWKATQAFVIIGFFLGVGGTVMSVLSGLKKNKTFHLIASILCIAAAGCILLAIIIFGAETTIGSQSQWGWGFILCIVSTFLLAPAGVLNFMLFRNPV